MAFFKSESLIEIFDKKIAAVPINAVAIEKEIKRLERALKTIRREISIKTKSDTGVTKSLYENMVKYATELGVGNSESIANSYLFTSNLKDCRALFCIKPYLRFVWPISLRLKSTLESSCLSFWILRAVRKLIRPILN